MHSTVQTALARAVTLLVFAAAVPSLLAADAAPKLPANFSAEIVTKLPVGGEMKGKYYKRGKKLRMEYNFQGQEMITLVDPDNMTTTSLMPAQKMATKMKTPALKDSPWLAMENNKTKPQKVGNETINGKATTKYQISTDPETKMFYWLDTSTSMPVRMETASPAGSVVMDFLNVKLDPPPASLFEIPEGYQVMESNMPMIPGGGQTP